MLINYCEKFNKQQKKNNFFANSWQHLCLTQSICTERDKGIQEFLCSATQLIKGL